MDVIKDQREMLGVSSVEEWEHRLSQLVEEPVKDRRTIAPYVNGSRWVADCPECNGGIACWDENPKGFCADCGHVFKVKFPPTKTREKALVVLAERPARNRNWNPDTEDVARLKVENELLLGVV